MREFSAYEPKLDKTQTINSTLFCDWTTFLRVSKLKRTQNLKNITENLRINFATKHNISKLSTNVDFLSNVERVFFFNEKSEKCLQTQPIFPADLVSSIQSKYFMFHVFIWIERIIPIQKCFA